MRNKKTLFILGVVLILIGIVALIPLYFLEIPKGNSGILSTGVGIILGWGSMAMSFYFGNTDS